MSINFPASPANGTTITVSNPYGTGPVYRYSSGAWRRSLGTALQSNKFVNPSFQINDQNGLADGTNVDTLVMAEQYNMRVITAGQIRGQRLALATPRGGNYRLRFSTTTADAGGVAGTDWLALQAYIEGNRMVDFNYGTQQAIFSVLRFGVKAPAGTYVLSIRNNAVTRTFLCIFTVTAARANIDTEFSFSIPPCVDGAWLTDNGVWAWFSWAVDNASGFTGNTGGLWLAGNYAGHNTMTNNFTTTVGKVFEFFDFGLYPDPLATGVAPEFQVPNIEDVQQDCLRYWAKAKGFRGVVVTATQGRVATGFPVPMRVGPAIALVGAPRIYDVGAAPSVTSISGAIGSPTHYELFANATGGGLTAGRPCQLLVDGDETAYISMNAR